MSQNNDTTDSFDLIEESDEISKLQNLNQKLNIEICNLQISII